MTERDNFFGEQMLISDKYVDHRLSSSEDVPLIHYQGFLVEPYQHTLDTDYFQMLQEAGTIAVPADGRCHHAIIFVSDVMCTSNQAQT